MLLFEVVIKEQFLTGFSMATGWAPDGAVQDQIDASVEDAVKRARDQLPQGESLQNCDECGELIPQARREAIRGVRFCIQCQSQRDEELATSSLMNRRASKDSQLR